MTAGNELCVWLKVVGGDPRGDWVEKEEPSGKRRFGPRLPSLCFRRRPTTTERGTSRQPPHPKDLSRSSYTSTNAPTKPELLPPHLPLSNLQPPTQLSLRVSCSVHCSNTRTGDGTAGGRKRHEALDRPAGMGGGKVDLLWESVAEQGHPQAAVSVRGTEHED